MPTVAQLSAFASYNFDEDPRWLDYKLNLMIPPGRHDEAAIFKRYKQKFYKRYIDPDFEVSAPTTTTSSGGGSWGEAGPSGGGQRAPPQNQPPGGGASSSSGMGGGGGQAAAAAPPGAVPGRGGLGLDAQTIALLLNAWVVVMAVLCLAIGIPTGLSNRAYKYALLGSAAAKAQSLWLRFGRQAPRSWNLAAIGAWAQPILTSGEILPLMYCVIFITGVRPLKLAVLPIGTMALAQVARRLKRGFSQAALYKNYLERGCLWLEANDLQLQSFVANTEISIGFMLIVQIFSPTRNIIQAFVYWQFLKQKYHAPTTSQFHRHTWAAIGGRVEPVLQQYLPAVLGPLSYVKRWFLTVR